LNKNEFEKVSVIVTSAGSWNSETMLSAFCMARLLNGKNRHYIALKTKGHINPLTPNDLKKTSRSEPIKN
jgi:hypothetical protein